MEPFVLIDGRPAQGKPRGMGVYVSRLVSALAELQGGVAVKVALDQQAGEDPWPQSNPVEKIWDQANHAAHWEQQVLPALGVKTGASLIHLRPMPRPGVLRFRTW